MLGVICYMVGRARAQRGLLNPIRINYLARVLTPSNSVAGSWIMPFRGV